ncbi:MAG: alcohol dehydrogenase catalytic domain-containing protein, partial [bacterium]|nr:alcohol dehydrogenase catalytic domain-containing protein [bacterium]
ESKNIDFKVGEYVGQGWMYNTCKRCKFCKSNLENLCYHAKFTGYDYDGGFSDYFISDGNFLFKVNFDVATAPLLCGGVIGYRAYKLTGVSKGGKIGLVGFGSSAHILLSLLKNLDINTYVFSKTESHRKLARKMGANWVGDIEKPPKEKLDGVIIFAPLGEFVVKALDIIDRAGSVVIAGIHMTKIPSFLYSEIYYEKSIITTSNATFKDYVEFLNLATIYKIKPHIEVFSFRELIKAINLVDKRQIDGSAVVVL